MNILHVNLENAVNKASNLKEKPADSSVECCIFLDLHPVENCISCPAGHYVSKEALEKYVSVELEKPLATHLKGLKCPKCDETYQGEDVTKCLSPEMQEKFRSLQKKCEAKTKFEEEVAEKEDLETIQETIRLQFKDAKGNFPGCYMCPICGFGPVDKRDCDDLKAHHQQRIADGVFIDNSCPMCHFYSSHVRNWKRWNGSFLNEEKMTRICGVKSTVQAEYELVFDQIKLDLKEVEVDSEAKWKKASSEYLAWKSTIDERLAAANCRPADVISMEMRTAPAERQTELGQEFFRSLRIYNPRMDQHGVNTYKSESDWVRAQKKALNLKLSGKLREMKQEILSKVKKSLDS